MQFVDFTHKAKPLAAVIIGAFLLCVLRGPVLFAADDKPFDQILDDITSGRMKLDQPKPAKVPPKKATPKPTTPPPRAAPAASPKPQEKPRIQRGSAAGLPDSFGGKKIYVVTGDESALDELPELQEPRPKRTPEAILEAANEKLDRNSKPNKDCAPKPESEHSRTNRKKCDSRFEEQLVRASWARQQFLPMDHGASFSTNDGKWVNQPEYFNKSCFEKTLKRSIGSVDYHLCEPDETLSPNPKIDDLVDTEPICLNDKYVNLMHGSFNLVLNCTLPDAFGAENAPAAAKAIFGLFKHESGFHMNAFSSTRAGGIGQLTADAIEDFNDGSALKKILQNSRYGICQRLAELPKLSTSNACDRVSMDDGNPFNNMIYAISYIHGNFLQMQKTVRQYKNKFASFGSDDVDSSFRKFEMALALWAHNAGRPTIDNALEKVLKRTQIPITEADLLNQNSDLWKALRDQVGIDEKKYRTRKLTDKYARELKNPKTKKSTENIIQALVDKRVSEAKSYLGKVLSETKSADSCK